MRDEGGGMRDEGRRAGRWTRRVAAALAIAAAMALAGCDYFVSTSVKDILASPLKYEGQEVRLKGTVTDVTQLPLLDTKAYTLQDGDAKIVVIVTQGQLPAVKDTVKLKGTVKSTMIVNGKAVGQRVEETQRIK
jgi:predicted lipoprotein